MAKLKNKMSFTLAVVKRFQFIVIIVRDGWSILTTIRLCANAWRYLPFYMAVYP